MKLDTHTTYGGTYNGRTFQSIYPNLYRVTYDAFIAGRHFPIDDLVTARDEHDARARITRRHDVRGGISVEHVHTLAVES